MGFSVTSSFIGASRSKTPDVIRRFTIAGSDYSSRVTKWPVFNRAWDDIRPKTLTLKLANEDQALNIFRNDKTLMEGECIIQMGFNIPVNTPGWDISAASYDSISLDISGKDTNPSDVFFKPDGTKLYILGNITDTIYQYTLSTAWDVSTASYDSVSFDISGKESISSGIFFKPDGFKFYITGFDGGIALQYTLSTAWDVSTASYDFSYNSLAQDTRAEGLSFKSDGTKMYLLGGDNDAVFQYTLSTAWDISTASYDNKSIVVSGQDTVPRDVFFRPDNGLTMYILGDTNNAIYQYTLSTAWDVSTASYDSVSFDVSSEETGLKGFFFDAGRFFIIGTVNDTVYQYTIPSTVFEESIDLFTGKIRGTKYIKEGCTLTIADKFQQLSERQVGTSDVPVTYIGSNYLPSDVAWWTVTSYGGYSNVQSISNPDIDFADFQEWASVFSGDSVFVNANFDGQKCTEILRKIARQTHSAVFIKEDKLSFHRFGIVDPNVTSLGPSEILDLELSFDTNNIINRQFVSGDYSIASDTHQFTVLGQSTASVNSFGPKDNTIEDNSFWYVDSGSAINLAQRKILADADPDDSLKVTTGLAGLNAIVGETVFIADAFHNISESYRILSHTVDTDKGRVTIVADRTQLSNGFILDTTSLGSLIEVLS